MANTAREFDKHVPKEVLIALFGVLACFNFLYVFTYNSYVVLKNEQNIFLKIIYTFHYYTTVPLFDLLINSYFAIFNILVRFDFIGVVLSYVITTIFFVVLLVYLFASIFLLFRVIFEKFPTLVVLYLLFYFPSLTYYIYVSNTYLN
jgi:hypothetical protein